VPRFDLVRIAPDGAGVAAGRAAPGATVRLRAGDVLLAETEAGPGGDFAALFDLPAGTGPQAIDLTAQAPGGAATASSQTVLVTPPETAAGNAAAAPAPEPPAPEPVAKAAGEPARTPATAPAIVVAAPEGARLMQPAGPVAGPAADPVPIAIEMISYTEDGAVEIAGRGRPGALARLYLDNRAAAEAPVGRDGLWQALLRGVAPGLYTLRADEIGAAGAVVSRIETPFQRAEMRSPAAALPGTGAPPAVPRVTAVTIQPGDTLWHISRDTYGAGIRYVHIYQANRDRIRNPDLIYPGQIFDLPDMAE